MFTWEDRGPHRPVRGYADCGITTCQTETYWIERIVPILTLNHRQEMNFQQKGIGDVGCYLFPGLRSSHDTEPMLGGWVAYLVAYLAPSVDHNCHNGHHLRTMPKSGQCAPNLSTRP